MSYARFGPGSDVYVFATTISDRMGENKTLVIECCNCQLLPRDDDGYPLAPFPRFATTEALLAHLQKHRDANQLVPYSAFSRIGEDGWLEASNA